MPDLVVTEVVYLINRALGSTAEAAFLRSIELGELTVEHLNEADWGRMALLVSTYADLPLGSADASVVAVAERLGVTEVATLDRRHFSVVRPSHTEAFHLLP